MHGGPASSPEAGLSFPTPRPSSTFAGSYEDTVAKILADATDSGHRACRVIDGRGWAHR